MTIPKRAGSEDWLILVNSSGTVVCDTQLVGRRRSVPVVYVQGSHYDVGFDVGRIFGSLIKEFLATYENLRDFEREARTENGRQAYDVTLTNMKTRFPYYVKEIQGVADGAGVPFFQLFLLQMDDLIGTVNENHEPRKNSGGCSSIGVNVAGKAVLGHTEDAFAATLNHFYILSAHVIPTPEDKAFGAVEERFASLCYAGHLPGYTMGYNEHGLVFSINTLSPLVLKPGHTPRTFLARALLSSKCLSDAHRILQDEGLGVGNGFSVNMLWSEPDGGRQLLNVEVAPDPKRSLLGSMLSTLKYDKEPLMHCNLYLRLPVAEVIGPIIDSSKVRMEVIRGYAQPQGRKDVEDILSDNTGDQFQVFQDRKDAVIKTIAAGIFDLEEKTWSIYINEPNASEPVAILPIRFLF